MGGISAQGSTVHIATGSGSAINISGITIGSPAIVTLASPVANGDVIAIAGVVGTVGDLVNGKSFVAANVNGNKAALLAVDSTGLTYTSGGTATPATYTKINNVTSFNGLDGAAGELDTTDLDSEAFEYISGLRDEGKFGFDIKIVRSDLGQQALEAARVSGAVKGMKLTLPDASVASFNVLVKTTPINGAKNSVLTGSVDCKITGAVSWA